MEIIVHEVKALDDMGLILGGVGEKQGRYVVQTT
jgi:hypothetical protein